MASTMHSNTRSEFSYASSDTFSLLATAAASVSPVAVPHHYPLSASASPACLEAACDALVPIDIMLPPVHAIFDSAVVSHTLPWWDAAWFAPTRDDTSAVLPTAQDLVEQYVDEFAPLRRRRLPSLPNMPQLDALDCLPSQAEYQPMMLTPPQCAELRTVDVSTERMPTELLEAAAVALLASGAASSGRTGAVRNNVQAHRRSANASPMTTYPVQSQLPQPTAYYCRWHHCRHIFSTAQALTEHVASEHIARRQDAYYCQWQDCKRARHCFRQRDKVLVHMRLHTGDRRFRCPAEGCGREFSRADCFEEHRRVHSAAGRECACPVLGCGKRYFHGKSLRKHQRLVHGMVLPVDASSMATPTRTSSIARDDTDDVLLASAAAAAASFFL